MTVNTEDTSRQSPIRTGEVELLEFFAQRRASDGRDREIRVPMSGRWCGGEECAADDDAVVASARLLVGKVRTALD